MNKKTLSFFRFCHQWPGLICGWFLFILFISGTVSIFDKEITQWMQPELGLYAPTHTISNTALKKAISIWEQHKDIPKNLIALPSSRDPFIRVLHAQDNMLQGSVIHPQQGVIIPVRATGGGYFIDSLHNNLFIGRFVGGAIVLTIGIIFSLVLISGVIIYIPNIIKNIFFVCPKPETARFKSDLHTITGIFFLPFLLIISISGILFLAPRYLPNDKNHSLKAVIHQHKQSLDRIQHSIELLPLLNKATIYFNGMPGTILFTKKEIKFLESDQGHIAHLKNHIAFDKQTAETSSTSPKVSPLTLFNKTLLGIHTARGGDTLLRIIFALMGIFSSILVACGLLFFTHKKRNQKSPPHSAIQCFFYKIIEGINIGVIMGSLIGIMSLLWLNRLLPTTLIERMHWEIRGLFISFFIIFCCSLIASICNKNKLIWLCWIGLFIILCLFLPIIDYIQTAISFKTALLNDNYLYLTIDLVIFIFGLIFLKLFFYLQSKRIN